MEQSLELSPVVANCRACATGVQEADQFCQSCGFPLKGSEQDQENFIYNRNYQHLELQGLDKKIKSAGTTLYVLAGLSMLSGIIFFFIYNGQAEATAELIAGAVIAIIYFLLALWSKKKPVAAIISGLVLFFLVWILTVIADPVNIVSGIIFKIIILVYLIKGMKSAFEAERIRKQHNIA